MEDDISGIYDDDGTKLDPEMIPKPSLCITCRYDDEDGLERMKCLLTRNDQRIEEDFWCDAYSAKF